VPVDQEVRAMGFGVSILLIAAGAVLRYGLTRDTWGEWDLDAIGMIAMVVGALGLFVSTLVWAPWRRRTVIDEPMEERHVHVRH
jgi:hypothetical protein